MSNWIKPLLFCCSGGLWLCEEDWVWEEDVDLLWNAGVCSTRDHTEQRPRHLSWLLVSRNPHVWALDWQVCISLKTHLLKDKNYYFVLINVSVCSLNFLLQPVCFCRKTITTPWAKLNTPLGDVFLVIFGSYCSRKLFTEVNCTCMRCTRYFHRYHDPGFWNEQT